MQQANQTGMSKTSPPGPTLYFAYGSNLSLSQMKQRCPGSTYTALARLKSWKWVISPRGYANVVQSRNEEGAREIIGRHADRKRTDFVYGLVYSLSLDGQDEDCLDNAEGVPWAYEKWWMEVEVTGGESKRGEEESGLGRMKLMVLVYVDPRGEERLGKARKEYIGRMNRGIEESVEKGLPMGYVEEVIRPLIPA